MALTKNEISRAIQAADRLLYLSSDYAFGIMKAENTDDLFLGSNTVYSKLTAYAKKIVRVQADSKMAEITSIATLISTQITAETEQDITDQIIIDELPEVFFALAGITKEDSTTVPTVTTDWSAGIWVNAGDAILYNAKRYIVNQSHRTQVGWEPPNALALFRPADIDEGTGLPIWVQPTGAHDAYAAGAQVTHNGSNWESDINANVWAPGVYGWTQI